MKFILRFISKIEFFKMFTRYMPMSEFAHEEKAIDNSVSQ